MIYLTNDSHDRGVYFDLRRSEPRRQPGGTERLFYGLLGNGVSELPVTVKSWRDSVEVCFGNGELFSYVEERTIRQMLGDMVREMTRH